MTTRTKLFASLGVSLAALMTATMAAAQTTSNTNSTPGAQDSGALEEVTVTAQRHTEDLQKVPVAVTSFSAEKLADQQVLDTLDLGRLVPNMFAGNNVGQASANVYYIRGLGQTQSFPTFEPQVGTYVDDIYISRQNANNFALFGVDQLQVLNGPQGTLFGRNSTGGAIVVTLQKPGTEFGGDVSASYGSFDGFSGHASVDMPVSDEFLTRTSIFGITNNGYVNDVTTHEKLNGVNDIGVREAFTVLPKGLSNVRWDLSVDYERNDQANLLNQPGPNGERISYSGFSTQGGALAPYLVGDKGQLGQGVVVQSWGTASNIAVILGSGTLNFITGFRGLNQALAADFAVGPFPLALFDTVNTGEIALGQTLRSYQFSQEVKWTDQVSDRFNYTVGAFYLFENNRNDYGQVLQFFGPAFPLNDQTDINDTISEAVYAQGDYKIMPDLTLTLGGRFTHEIKSVDAYPNQPGLGYTTAQIAALYPTHLDANEFTPRIALQYQVNDGLMVFASATRGFQGGGWNGLTGTNPQDFNSFKPETIWSYETGFRYQSSDNRFRLNTTAFYENIDDYQLLSDNPFTHSFDTSNGANMYAYGLEGSITWRPIDRLTFDGNFSSMKAGYFDQIALIRNQQAACIAGVPGNCDSGIVKANGQLATPVYTPPLDISASVKYDFDIDGFTLTPIASAQFVSREWFDTANTPGTTAVNPAWGGEDKARTLIDLGATLAFPNQPITITAECKNCSHVNYGTANLLNLNYYNYPGTWDVRVAYKF